MHVQNPMTQKFKFSIKRFNNRWLTLMKYESGLLVITNINNDYREAKRTLGGLASYGHHYEKMKESLRTDFNSWETNCAQFLRKYYAAFPFPTI